MRSDTEVMIRSVRLRLALALAVSAVVAACSSAVSSGESAGLHDPHPCPDVSGYTCSTLTVPLDHSGRRKGSLNLAVAASDNTKAARGVLLVLTGGPGQPGVQLLPRIPAILGAEQSAYRIVVYDQRGTGAGALRCKALQQAMGSSDLYPPPAAAVRACALKLGDFRQFFGTDDVVADMEDLRNALGVDRLSIDGISYGTYVGERYALAHPSRVSKLVLDSVVPHTGQTDLGVAEFAATARVLKSVCGTHCVSDLATVVRKHHDGPQLLDALTLMSIVDPTFTSAVDIPSVLRDARQGDMPPLIRTLALVRDWSAAPAEALDQGLHASALCADWRYPWGSSSAPLAGRTAALARALAHIPASSLYPFDRATAAGTGFVKQCLPWSPTPATPAPSGRITVPTLLVNGDHDLSTPLEWARSELKLIPNGRLVIVPGAGHSTQARAFSDVGRQAVAGFLLK
jgi:pimeloyl-ACP methyl ester carboxylesterase